MCSGNNDNALHPISAQPGRRDHLALDFLLCAGGGTNHPELLQEIPVHRAAHDIGQDSAGRPNQRTCDNQ